MTQTGRVFGRGPFFPGTTGPGQVGWNGRETPRPFWKILMLDFDGRTEESCGTRMSIRIDNPSSQPEGSGPWSERTLLLCREWQAADTDEARNRILSELWVLINAVLARYVRIHSRSLGKVDTEEVRDIASEKAMAFVHNLRNGNRDADVLHASQMSAYVSVLARNGLVDALRKSGRNERSAGAVPAVAPVANASEDAESGVRHEQFLTAIRDCVGALTPRARNVWFFRAYLDMTSREIAAHPDVGMTASAVDMLLSRTRRALGECMSKKGLNADDAPPGAFVALWELLNNKGKKDVQGT